MLTWERSIYTREIHIHKRDSCIYTREIRAYTQERFVHIHKRDSQIFSHESLHVRERCSLHELHYTGWRRLIGCLQLQVILHKRATNYRALLQKMTYEDKTSYDSTPFLLWQDACICHFACMPCIYVCVREREVVYVCVCAFARACMGA